MFPPGFLYLDRFTCIRQRDHALDGDTPYFLILVAQSDASCELVRVTHAAWDDAVRSGDTLAVSAWVHGAVAGDSLVYVALLEQNWRRDVQEAEMNLLRAGLSDHWRHIADNVVPEERGERLRRAFRICVGEYLHNDRLIDIEALSLDTHHGVLPALDFAGARARYRATFAIRSVAPAT